jgi:hypothetical protein
MRFNIPENVQAASIHDIERVDNDEPARRRFETRWGATGGWSDGLEGSDELNFETA